VIGLDPRQLRAVLEQAGHNTVDIANFNEPRQTVISGINEDVLSLRGPIENAGAERFIPLPVSGAFHSRYMQPIQREFDDFLSGFSFSPPRIPVVANVTARPHEQEQIKANLCKQITSPVRWVESVEFLLQQPQTEFSEIGPGNVLTGMIRRIK